MDKKPHVKPYLYGMLAGFGAISLSIIFFFLIYRFDGFGDAISTLTGILMPFIYGAVIAYLLKPVCNTIESFLRRFIPEKMHGLVNVLSITLTILFGLLLIYALCMMIIPQLITSVTTLYYTAQRNLAKFVQWANHVEFIENNQQIMDMLNSAYATISTNIDDLIKTRLLPSMQNIVSGAAVGVLNVVTMAKNLIIGIIVAVYMLASRKRFVQQAKLVLYSIFKPRWAELIKEEVKYADKMFGGFINGKIMDSAIIGVLCYIGCLIFKFPSALLVSVIIGVTNVILPSSVWRVVPALGGFALIFTGIFFAGFWTENKVTAVLGSSAMLLCGGYLYLHDVVKSLNPFYANPPIGRQLILGIIALVAAIWWQDSIVQKLGKRTDL